MTIETTMHPTNRLVLVACAMLVALAMVFFAQPSAAYAATNHSQAEAVAWANARQAEGWNVNVDGSYGVQCVDLILAYYDYLVGYHVSGNAIDYTGNQLPSGWTRVYSDPHPGDIVVWNRGAQLSSSSIGPGNEWADSSYGHIGICTEVRNGYIVTIETNTYYGGTPAHPFDRMISGVACYIRPDFASHNPVGYLDHVYGGPGQIYVDGWTYDPDSTSSNLEVHVYVGGAAGDSSALGYNGIIANRVRSDVNSVTGVSGNHGYAKVIKTTKRGSVPVYVYAINVGSGYNVPLGSGTVYITDEIGDEFTGTISSTLSNRLLVENENSGNVELGQTSSASAREEWCFKRMDSGFYTIKSAYSIAGTSSGWMGAESADVSANVKTLSCSASDSRVNWLLISLPGGGYNLAPEVLVGARLDVNNAGTTAGANVKLWENNGHQAQTFNIKKLNAVIPTGLSDITYDGGTITHGGRFRVEAGKALQLHTALQPSNVTSSRAGLVWYSNDSSIATVDQNGVLTAVSPGTVSVGVRSAYNPSLQHYFRAVVLDPVDTDPVPTAEDSVAVASCQEAVSKLPSPDDVTLADAEAIEAALSAVNGLTSAQRSLLTDDEYNAMVGKVQACKAALTKLQEQADASKAANPLVVKAKSKTLKVKYAKLKKKAQTIKKSKAFVVKGAKGKVTFVKLSGNKKITVSKSGTIKIKKKGLKKGKKYTVKVMIIASGDAHYKATTRNVTLKIKVK